MVTAFQRLHATEKNIHVRPAIGITRLGSSRQFSLGSIAEAEGSGSDESKIAKDEDKVIRETNEAEIIAQLKVNMICY